MSTRRMMALGLLLALLSVAFPTAGQATMSRDAIDVHLPGFLERIAQAVTWVENAFQDLTQQFVTSEGAGMTSGG